MVFRRRPSDRRVVLRATLRCFSVLGSVVLGLLHVGPDARAAADGPQRDVVFTDYSLLASNPELVRRIWSPLAAAQAQQIMAASGGNLTEQAINLAEERFVIYVPSQPPPRGYALLVFVPPWQDARLPRGWAAVLDHYGVIFVSAARSGNEENAQGRREPLALLAAVNIINRYAVDPGRVYIAGFSGGARVAMRLALAYPDLFRGGLLDAGSDPIGNTEAPLPPKELFSQFQSATRLIYVTGEDDLFHLGMAAESMQSMRDWCVFDVSAQVIPHAAHELAGPAALSRALGALLNPAPPDPNRIATCRAAIDAEMTAKLREVETLVAGGKRDDAKQLLLEIDGRFGGLAAPRSVELGTVLN